MPQPPDYVTIGEVLAAHGVRGELRVTVLTDFPKRFLALRHVFLTRSARAAGPTPPAPPAEFRVLTARLLGGGSRRLFPVSDPADADRSGPWAGHTQHALIKLAGVNDRDAAEAWRGALLQLPAAEAWPLPDDTFYAFQLYDLPVVTAAGQTLGTVEDLLATGSNDVYLVRTPEGRELLVPAIQTIVEEINPAAGYIRIKDPAEWLDEQDTP